MTRPPRPIDSAALVILRGRGARRAVLMGRRRAASAFMPGWYVFPGGRIEAADFPSPACGGDRRLCALAMTAIRETFEETGLIVGRRGAAACACGGDCPGWRENARRRDGPFARACAAAGLAPAPAALTLIARAITPTFSPRRFHARFFLVDAREAHGDLRSNGELEDLRWVPLDDPGGLPIADVTAFVLDRAARAAASPGPGSGPVPLFCYRAGRHRVRHPAQGQGPKSAEAEG